MPVRLVPALLPLAGWLLLFTIARAHGREWRDAFILSLVGWGVWVWIAAEVQSLTVGLNPTATLSFWLGTTGLLLAVALWTHRRRRDDRVEKSPTPLLPRDRASFLLLIAIATASLIVGLIAAVCPVMSWDALAYHLPRIFYWVQYDSIAHFPAANHRQLFMGPWPAFAQLQHYLLAGSDRLANLLQWLAMVASVITVSAIARDLGAGRRAQVVASALAISIPMGILQGSTALTDYVVTCWLAVFVYFVVRRLGAGHFDSLDRLTMGAALGLAVASKATAIPLATPFLVVYATVELRHNLTTPAAWWRVVAVGSMALVLNLPHIVRNHEVFGHPIAPLTHRQLVGNESFHPRYLISNLARHGFAHLGTWNEDHARPLMALSDRLHDGLGIEDGDQVNSHNGQALWIPPLSMSESTAGNAFHLLLYLICAVLLGLRILRHDERRLVVYGLCLVSGAVLFVLLVKYQHSISRLHLPLFVLACPWAATTLERALSPRIALITGWLLLVAALPYLVRSESRPLIGPDNIWRTPRKQLQYWWEGSYEPVVNSIAKRVSKRNVATLGLINNGDMLEYYLWHALRTRCETPPRIENVSPEGVGGNDLALTSNLTSAPLFAIRFAKTPPPSEFRFLDREYQKVHSSKFVALSIYRRERTQ
ncbi:MAG: glycosyltransferase family 39 protein [Thermoanaerobaculia bacterium]